MKKYLEKRENRITLIFFIITMITATSPLISRYCINGHDIEYHLLRIESLKEGILIGRPFLKVNTLFFGGAGYASSMFYSDIFMHIPALLRVLHVSIGKSFHIYTALIFILTYISTFYCVWKMSMSKFAGTVAAILLTLCPYHMDDMLVRTACGENTAFIFIPLAVYGVFNVLYEDMDKPWVFGLGFAGLILAHPATCILTFFFAFAVFVINAKYFVKDARIFVRLCVVAALALLVTAYQWLPMLEQFMSADFYVANNWTDLLDASVGFADVASGTFPCVGFILFALALPRFFLSKKDYPILGFVDLMMIFAVVFAVGATNIMPWERVARYFGFLQFPWRLFIMSSVFLAMADAIVLKLFLEGISEEKRGFAREVLLIVILAVTAFFAINHQNQNSMGYYDYSDDYYSYKPYTANVIAGEWLPQTVTESGRLISQSESMVYDDGSTCAFERNGSEITAHIDAGHEYVDVPFVYYKGYSAVLTDAEGNRTKLLVSGEGDNGLCRVELKNEQGDLTVKYTGTVLQYISVIISHLFLLLIFDLWYLKNKYKKKLRSRAAAAGANLGKIACVLIMIPVAYCLASCNAMPGTGMTGMNGRADDGSIDYKDPDAMIDYLNYMNGTGDETGVGEELVRVNFSRKGYDSDEKGYAVLIDESSGEQVISVITPEEASEMTDETIPVTSGLYKKLLEDEIKSVDENFRTDSLKDRVMHETDALFCLEVFPELSRSKGTDELARKLGKDILDIPDTKIETTLDKYDHAAVLAKAAYVMNDWDEAQNAQDAAERYFKDAESASDQEGEPVAARLWAAAELYRLTGSKTYRSVVDAIAMDVITEGFTYEEPGFFGLFAYLMSPYPTNYNVCTRMMEVVFDKANALIKEPVENEFLDMRVDDSTFPRDEKTAQRMLSEAFLVTMTDYISVSSEYRDFVRDRLYFIYGANLSGTDFTDEDNVLCSAPKLFVISGVCR